MPIVVGASPHNPEGIHGIKDVELEDVYAYLNKFPRLFRYGDGSPKPKEEIMRVLKNNEIPDGHKIHQVLLLKEPKYKEPSRNLSAIGHGALQSATFGFGDEIYGALGGDKSAYRDKLKDLREDHGGAYFLGEMAGALPLGIGAGVAAGTRLGAKALSKIPNALRANTPSRVKNIGGAMASGSAIGGVGSGIYGFGTGDEEYPRIDKAINEGAMGALVGAPLGVAGLGAQRFAEKLRDSKALKGIDVVSDTKAKKALARQFRQAHKEDPEFIKKILQGDFGDEAMLADIPAMQPAASVVAKSGDPLAMSKALEARAGGSIDRLSKSLTESTSYLKSPHKIDSSLRSELSGANKKLQKLSSRHRERIRTGWIQNAWDRRLDDMGPDALSSVAPYLAALGDDAGQATFKKLHHLNEEMRRKVRLANKRGDTDGANVIQDLINDVQGTMRHRDPEYGLALKQREAVQGKLDNVRRGAESVDPALSKLTDRKALSEEVQNMAPDDRLAFFTGMRKFLEGKLEGANKKGATQFSNTLNKKGTREFVDEVLGPNNTLTRQVDSEGLYADTQRRILASAGQGQEARAADELGLKGGRAIRPGISYMGPKMAGIEVLNSVFSGLGAARRRVVADNLSKVLSSTGEERNRAIRQVGQYLSETPAYKRAVDAGEVSNYGAYQQPAATVQPPSFGEPELLEGPRSAPQLPRPNEQLALPPAAPRLVDEPDPTGTRPVAPIHGEVVGPPTQPPPPPRNRPIQEPRMEIGPERTMNFNTDAYAQDNRGMSAQIRAQNDAQRRAARQEYMRRQEEVNLASAEEVARMRATQLSGANQPIQEAPPPPRSPAFTPALQAHANPEIIPVQTGTAGVGAPVPQGADLMANVSVGAKEKARQLLQGIDTADVPVNRLEDPRQLKAELDDIKLRRRMAYSGLSKQREKQKNKRQKIAPPNRSALFDPVREEEIMAELDARHANLNPDEDMSILASRIRLEQQAEEDYMARLRESQRAGRAVPERTVSELEAAQLAKVPESPIPDEVLEAEQLAEIRGPLTERQTELIDLMNDAEKETYASMHSQLLQLGRSNKSARKPLKKLIKQFDETMEHRAAGTKRPGAQAGPEDNTSALQAQFNRDKGQLGIGAGDVAQGRIDPIKQRAETARETLEREKSGGVHLTHDKWKQIDELPDELKPAAADLIARMGNINRRPDGRNVGGLTARDKRRAHSSLVVALDKVIKQGKPQPANDTSLAALAQSFAPKTSTPGNDAVLALQNQGRTLTDKQIKKRQKKQENKKMTKVQRERTFNEALDFISAIDPLRVKDPMAEVKKWYAKRNARMTADEIADMQEFINEEF